MQACRNLTEQCAVRQHEQPLPGQESGRRAEQDPSERRGRSIMLDGSLTLTGSLKESRRRRFNLGASGKRVAVN